MRIHFQQACFIKSAAKLAQCPPDIGVEVAFVGRSNAGKSTLLNTLCSQKKLARTSKAPGRTQLLNFFGLDHTAQRRLVDLPGYGYAKVSHRQREEWDNMIDEYLSQRESLQCIILVMDIRHPMQAGDWQIFHWALDAKIPLHFVLTKADKLTRGAAANTLLSVLKPHHEKIGVTGQIFSSLTREGTEELKKHVQTLFDTASLGETDVNAST